MFGKKKDPENGDTRKALEKVNRRLSKQDHRIDEVSARVAYLGRIVEVQKRVTGTG